MYYVLKWSSLFPRKHLFGLDKLWFADAGAGRFVLWFNCIEMFFADKIQSNGRIDFVYLLYGDVADEFIFLVVLVVDVVVLLADVAHILIIL